MAQQDVLDYIRKTPHNSNVNVVKGMLGDSSNSALPEVTELDNGKVLTVVEGQWNKAEASSGGIDIPTITMTIYDTVGDITEEDANKIFNNYPIALKVHQVINGESSPDEMVCFLNTYNDNELMYQMIMKMQDMTVIFNFIKEQTINFVMAQGTTVAVSYDFTWEANNRRYICRSVS